MPSFIFVDLCCINLDNNTETISIDFKTLLICLNEMMPQINKQNFSFIALYI